MLVLAPAVGIVLLLAACREPSTRASSFPVETASTATAHPAPTASAAASCADAPGEPRAPVVECVFQRTVRCTPPSPVLSAWQKDFPACPPSLPEVRPTMLFSPCETRARRARGEDACCYVAHEPTACD